MRERLINSPAPQARPAASLLEEFFAPGVEAGDLPALFPLLRAREALDAFITLFRGGEDEVLVRLLVLREIGARAEAPRWSTQELQGHFAYLDPVKLDTVLKRLRDNDLLVWDGEERVYQLSGAGRIALSALANLLALAGEADAELGFITAQVAAGQAIGKVSAETLQHLLGRLNELQNEFDQAVLGGSEFRLRRAQDKLEKVFHWIEKGTEIMRAVTASGDLDTASYRIAQAIGQAQSRMLRMTGVFGRALNSLERQRVHLGESGQGIAEETPLADAVVGGGFGRAAYRLSLLALVGDAQSEAFAGPVAELACMPLSLTLSNERRPVGRDEVGELSEGMLAPSKREGRD